MSKQRCPGVTAWSGSKVVAMTGRADTDLAIVGSGFGGSILAMIARRLGYRVVLLERGRHPRFAIGESASPLAGILIEQLSDRYDLPRLRPLSAFGTWQRTYPHVVCGLKRGFTYFKHEPGRRYRVADDRGNQLLVAASPSDELSDTHWLRSDVDHFLVNEAIALGVEYRDLVCLERIEWPPHGDAVLVGTRQGHGVRVRTRFVLDASGPRGFLSNALGIEDQGFDAYPPTQALFSHFTDVARCDDMPEFAAHGVTSPPDPRGRTLAPSHARTFAPSDLPHPMDDAALHHVFDGGWMWVLRFGNGVTSAGVAVEDWLAEDLKLADGEPAWSRLLARFPSVAAQFADARPIRPFTWMPRLAYRAASAAGERWAMLPSAAAFIDPLFSTGIPLTLLGIERLAGLLEVEPRGLKPALYAGPRGLEVEPRGLKPTLYAGPRGLEVEPRGLKPALYADPILADADRTARFIAGSYAGFRQFPMFAAYSMFYFAAASFSEMARRSASPITPRGFLCGDSDAFSAALERLSPAVVGAVDVARYEREISAAVADWNVAGLCDPEKRNWYPVDLDDAIRNAGKLGLTRQQVRERLGPMACSP
jgi:tetracycline 7-halogenase / FADH2 O2-dependent halogenase